MHIALSLFILPLCSDICLSRLIPARSFPFSPCLINKLWEERRICIKIHEQWLNSKWLVCYGPFWSVLKLGTAGFLSHTHCASGWRGIITLFASSIFNKGLKASVGIFETVKKEEEQEEFSIAGVAVLSFPFFFWFVLKWHILCSV